MSNNKLYLPTYEDIEKMQMFFKICDQQSVNTYSYLVAKMLEKSYIEYLENDENNISEVAPIIMEYDEYKRLFAMICPEILSYENLSNDSSLLKYFLTKEDKALHRNKFDILVLFSDKAKKEELSNILKLLVKELNVNPEYMIFQAS